MANEPGTPENELLEAGQDVRVRRVSRMVPAKGPLHDSTRHDIRRALQQFMKDCDLSQSDVAKAVGSNTTYINNLLTNAASVPEETRDALLRDINNWLDREARARENVRPATFVDTKVATLMMGLGQRLSDRPDIGAAWGGAGIGKTITGEAIAAEHKGVYVRIDADSRSVRGFIRKLYNAASRKQRTAKPVRLDEVIEKLRMPAKITSPIVVVVDEAHQLRPAAREVIRDIFDQAQCSFLLIGTVAVKRDWESDNDPDFAQMSSRAGLKLDLVKFASTGDGGTPGQLFSIEDIRAFCSRGKIKLHNDAARMLLAIANSNSGHLRTVERLHYYAEKIAARRRSDFILRVHVEAAAQYVDQTIRLLIESEAAPQREAASA